jgi:DNA-binding beta-propeller fold protein YncE
VTNEIGVALTVIDVATDSIVKTISLSSPANPQLRPMGVVESQDGKLLYVIGRGGSLLEIDIAAGRVTRTIEKAGQRPWGLALSGDDPAATANGPGGDISVIDLASGCHAARTGWRESVGTGQRGRPAGR